MKNKGLVIKVIIGVFVFLIAVITGLYIKNNLILNRTYGYETGITNISQYVDEANADVSSASFVLENIDPRNSESLNGNRVRVYSNDDVELSFLNAQTNEEVPVNNNIITLDESGITVKVDGISKGNTYDIRIEPVENKKGYKASYKSSTITLDYTDVLSAYVKEIIDVNNEKLELSENDKIVFLYTDENDKIKLRANEDIDIVYTFSLDELSEEDLDNAQFETYDKNNYLQVATNGYLYAKAKYKTSGYSKISMLHVTNIDKLKPVVYDVSQVESSDHMSATVTFSIDDQEATKEYGKSNVIKYVVSKYAELQPDDEWIEAGAGTYNLLVSDNGINYIHVMDKAGNEEVYEYEVNISFEQEGFLVLILDSTDSTLVGKVYKTLMAMKADFDEHNLTNSDTVLAQIEGDIKNQYIDVENVDLTIDLNGYILESRDTKPTFNIKDGAKLKLVDNNYEIKDYIMYDAGSYSCDVVGDPITFDYTGSEAEFDITESSKYKLEVWGAQGGSNNNTRGGYGGYSSGYIDLNENDKLYINIGGQGTGGSSSSAGYNGGGYANHAGSYIRGAGGGATHIALESGLLSTFVDKQDKVLIVAGGGGGAGYYADSQKSNGGDAGGFKGKTGNGTSPNQIQGAGGTQVIGGSGKQNGSFGQGANRTDSSDYGGSGGGGGWYGGAASTNTAGGGGGSSYIGNSDLGHKYMACYECETSTSPSTRTISVSIYSANAELNTAKVGNGYAKLTKVECSDSDVDYSIFDHGTHYGTVRNVNHDAIMINNGGTLQIGEDNSPDLAHIEYPDHHSPYIVGKEKAIMNRGTLKYYDGVIYGGVALDGDVQDSPYIYDPAVVIPEDDTNYRMTLEKVTNIEAMIGKTRYSLLEEAIDAANNRKGTPDDQIKIDIVSDLAKDQVIEVNNQKNIILDLNGHSFTNTINDNVLVNYGKLVLMDSGDTGIITTHNGSSTIINNTNGQLTINSGTYTNDVEWTNTIINYGDARLIVNGGTLKHDYANNTNVINNKGGIVTINGGEFTKNQGSWGWGDESYGMLVYNTDYNSTDIADEEEDVDLSTLIKDSRTYGYTMNEDGSISPETLDRRDGTSNVYKEVDLTNYPSNKTYQVEVTADMNVRSTDVFYVYWATDINAAIGHSSGQGSEASNSGYYREIYVTGNQGTKTYKARLYGGRKYYVHFGFYNDNWTSESYPAGGDQLKITSIKIKKMHNHIGRVTIEGGDFIQASKCFYNASYDNQSFLNGGTYDCGYSAATIHGDITINGGTFNKQVVNGYDRTIFINGGTVKDIWNRSGTIRMNGGKVGRLYNRFDGNENAIHSHLDNYAYITGGEIYEFIDNYQTLDIKNALITGTINQYSKLPVNIDNTTFNVETQDSNTHYSIKSITDTGDVLIKDSTFTAEIKSRSNSYDVPIYHAVYKEGNSTLALDNVTMNLVGKLGYTGNVPNQNNYRVINAVSNEGNGNIYIDNSTINVSTDFERFKAYGIYNHIKGNIYIGKKDNNYEEDRVAISSDYHTIYSPQGFIHFYDGVLKGNVIATNDSINEIENGYYVYRYDNSGVDTIKLVNNNLGNVLNVGTNVTYNTLSEALDAAGNEATLRFLNNYSYETINRTNEIKNNQDITLDLNGKSIYFGAGLTNNGKLKVIDNSGSVSNLRSHKVINNNELSLEAGNWTFELESTEAIINNGKLTVKTSTIQSTENNNNDSLILNNGQLYVQNGAKITTGENMGIRDIYNKYTGSIYLTGGVVESNKDVSNLWRLVAGRTIYNEGGYLELNGGTIEGLSYSNWYGSEAKLIENTVAFPDGSYGNLNNGSYRMNYDYITVPIDLTDYSGTVTVNVEYDSYNNNKDNWFAITDSIDNPTGTFEKIASGLNEETYDGKITTTVQGGQKYYLHGYAANCELYVTKVYVTQDDNKEDIIKRGKIVIIDGSIIDHGDDVAIRNFNSDVELRGGEIKKDNGLAGAAVVSHRDATVSMTGGKVINKIVGFSFYEHSHGYFNGGEISMSGSNYYESIGLYLDNGHVTVEDIDIDINSPDNSTRTGINMHNSSTIDMTGGTIDVKAADWARGIYMVDTTKANVENVTINPISKNNSSYGAYLTNSAEISVKNSTFTADVSSTSTSTNRKSYGIYSNGSNKIKVNNSSIIGNSEKSWGILADGYANPTLELNNDDTNGDGFVSQTTPVISGHLYGILRYSGTFNYYDGIVKGETQISGGVTDRPQGYELKYGNDGTLPTVVLEKLDLVENIDTGVKYSTIQAAFDACPANETCNLKQIYDAMLSTKHTVDANKIINYNINNFTLSTTGGKYIENNGSLTFSNGDVVAQSVSNFDPIVDNYGKLYISTGAKLTTGDCVAARVIKNNVNAELYVNGGTLESNQSPADTGKSVIGRIIYNEGGYVELNGGTIEGLSHGIWYGSEAKLIENTVAFPDGSYGNLNNGSYRMNYDYITVPIDLTDYSGTVTVNVEYDSYNNNKDNWFAITDSIDNPTGTFEKIASGLNEETYDGKITTTVQGGQKYYLHGYAANCELYVTKVYVTQDDNKEDIIKRGKIVIIDGSIIDHGDDVAIRNLNSDVELRGGEIKKDNGLGGIGVANYRDATFTMTGGTILNKNTATIFYEHSHGYFTGGLIKMNNNNYTSTTGIYIDYGDVNIDGLTIDINVPDGNDRYGIRVKHNSTLNMTSGSITVVGSQYTRAISLEEQSKANLENVTINASSVWRNCNGIALYSTPDVSIKNSTINANITNPNSQYPNESYGIYVEASGNININNSDIIAHSNNYDSSGDYSHAYGIYVFKSYKPKITLSNDDDEVSQLKPYIHGDTYGIYRKGDTLNFYDGIIEGTDDIHGGITKGATGYQLKYGTNGNFKTITLDHVNTIINTDTNAEYDNLQSAFNNCPDNELCNLKQIYKINNFEKVTVPSAKNIEFNGNGQILSVVNGHNIINNGIFKYYGGTVEAQSTFDNTALFENYGKLYIENTANLTANDFGGARLLFNGASGELYINGGTITNTAFDDDTYNDGRLVYNEGGYVEINGGNLTGLSYSDYGKYSKDIVNTTYITGTYTGVVENGVLRTYSNNTHSTIEVDLSEFTGDVALSIKYDYINDKNGYLAINESPDVPSGTDGRIVTISEDPKHNQIATTTVQGGKKYYLHYHGYSGMYIYLSSIDAVQGTNKKEFIKHGTLKINGGTITDRSIEPMIVNYNSNLEVNGGTIQSSSFDGRGVINYRAANFKMTGGTFHNQLFPIQFIDYSYGTFTGGNIVTSGASDTSRSDNYGINIVRGHVNISNINIDMENIHTNDYWRNGIRVLNDSTLNMTGGTINVTAPSSCVSGIYVDNTAFVELGSNDGLVSKTNPHITGDKYGIYINNDNATFNFYDGRITSPNIQIKGTVDDIPQDYRIIQDNNDYFLDIRSAFENTFEYNHMYFESINMAIQVIGKLEDKTGIIKLWNDATLLNQVVIPEGYNITIALEGHTLDFNEGTEVGIVNNGTLTIIDGIGDEIDSSTDSKLLNNYGVAIQNNGTLNVGVNGNPNSRSPHIKGTTAVTGNSANLLSGKIESTDGGIIQTIGAFLANLFTFDVAPSSYAYKSSIYQVNNLPDNTILATSPSYRSVESLVDWTNNDINVGMTSHNVGILNLVDSIDPNQTKEIEYTIEVYKNGVLDEFYTYKKVIDVQYLDDDTLNVDLDYFDDVENKFKDYYLTKMTINDIDTNEVPELVYNGTVFKLYYGQTKGEEIHIINPKTGRTSYKIPFLIALIATIFMISFMMSKYIKNLQLKEDTI